jgi:hypothetical protein
LLTLSWSTFKVVHGQRATLPRSINRMSSLGEIGAE